MARELHERISHSQLILLEGDHMIARKDPDLILDHVMIFLKKQEMLTKFKNYNRIFKSDSY